MERIEPVLPMPDRGSNSLRDEQLKQFERTNNSMTRIVQPVGASAKLLDFYFDTKPVGRYSGPTKEIETWDESILIAISALREK